MFDADKFSHLTRPSLTYPGLEHQGGTATLGVADFLKKILGLLWHRLIRLPQGGESKPKGGR